MDRILGRAVLVSAANAEVFVEALLEPVEAGWRARLSMTDAQGAVLGTRELSTSGIECAAIDEAAALAISLMIDPNATVVLEPPAPTAPTTNRETEAPLHTHAPPPRQQPSPRPQPPAERWSLGIHGGLALAFGLLPVPAVGVSAQAEIRPPSFVLMAVQAVIYRTTPTELRSGLGADLLVAYGGLELCPLGLGGDWRVLGCAGLNVGTIRSRGFGFDRSFDDEGWVANAVGRVRMSRRLVGPLTVHGAGGLGAPLIRHRFQARDSDGAIRELFRMAPALVQLEIGVGAVFP